MKSPCFKARKQFDALILVILLARSTYTAFPSFDSGYGTAYSELTAAGTAPDFHRILF